MEKSDIDYKPLKEGVELMFVHTVKKAVKKAIEDELPEGKTIESSSDEELGKALEKIHEKYGDNDEQ